MSFFAILTSSGSRSWTLSCKSCEPLSAVSGADVEDEMERLNSSLGRRRRRTGLLAATESCRPWDDELHKTG